MARVSPIARQELVRVLQRPELSAIDFTIGGQSLDQSFFEAVRSVLTRASGRKGHVLVERSSDVAGSYHPARNTMTLGNDRLRTVEDEAIALHEMVHLGFDLRRAPVAWYVNEMAAYVADALYSLVRSPPRSDSLPLIPDEYLFRRSGETAPHKVYAYMLALDLRMAKRRAIRLDEIAFMKAMLLTSPTYSARADEPDQKGAAANDGI